jgi:hypothetical protein
LRTGRPGAGHPLVGRGRADQREAEVRDPLHETEQLRLIADHDDGVAALGPGGRSLEDRASELSQLTFDRQAIERRGTERPLQVQSPVVRRTA